MAHLAKVKKGAVGHMSGHYRREEGKEAEFVGLHSHSDIDPGRTRLNYNLSLNDYSYGKCMDVLEKHGVKVLKRKDVNVLCDWCCTLPEGFEGSPEEFFKATYIFIKERYSLPDWAIQSAYVHMDETTPHMHFSFMPVSEKGGKKKLSAKELIDRKDLQTFHQDYEKEMRQQWPDICILNEATRDGNKSITELKKQTRMEEQAALEKSIQELEAKEFTLRYTLESVSGRVEKKRAELSEIMQYINERAGEADRLSGDVDALIVERARLSDQLHGIHERIDSVDSFVLAFERAAGRMKESMAVRELMGKVEGQIRKPLQEVRGKAKSLEEVLARIDRRSDASAATVPRKIRDSFER